MQLQLDRCDSVVLVSGMDIHTKYIFMYTYMHACVCVCICSVGNLKGMKERDSLVLKRLHSI